MTLRPSELERLADDIYKDRRLTVSTYCGNCGYNLRTLPYVYHCPECGQSYNARPLIMTGVFAPYDVEIPWNDMMGAAAFLAGTAWAVVNGASKVSGFWLSIAGVFLVFSIAFLHRSYGGLCRFLKVRKVTKRIEMEERET